MTSLLGQTVSHYKILERIGTGGMGVVYRAQDLKLDRCVALKFLHPSLSTADAEKSRFVREARALSALEHPNICTIYEIGETPDERLFIAMPCYEGESLRARIERGPIPAQEAISIASQVALGLHAAHAKGIIHRDIKSANIMITNDGQVKIMDFGLARPTEGSVMTGPVTQMGTIAYMSPEQLRGEAVDQRTDIWSLGVVLFEMLTGRLPFAQEYADAVAYAVQNESPPSLAQCAPDVPLALQRVVERCLQRDPTLRFSNAGELADAMLHGPARQSLRGLLTGTRRRRRLVMTGALALAVGLILFALFSVRPVERNRWVLTVRQPNPVALESADAAGMVSYLLRDQVLQPAGIEPFTAEEFNHLFPGRKPEYSVDVSLTPEPVGYNLAVSVEHANGALSEVLGSPRQDTTYWVVDNAGLLTTILPSLRSTLVSSVRQNAASGSRFTYFWDAFKCAYDGESAWKKIDLTKAKQCFECALQIDKQFVLAKLRLAQVLEFGGHRPDARAIVSELRPFLSLLSRTDSLTAEALDACLAGDLRTSIAILRQIYEIAPLRAEHRYNVAEAYFRIFDIPAAIDFYLKTLEVEPDFARAHNHLAYCYSHQGDHQQALVHFRRYVELDSTSNAFDSLGDGYLAEGSLDSAVWAKREAVRRDPQIRYTYRGLAHALLQQGRFVSARANADRIRTIALTPEDEMYAYVAKGEIEMELGNDDTALRYLAYAKKCFDSDEMELRNHELHWLLGLIALHTRNEDLLRNELGEMGRIILENQVNATNYGRGVYKYMLHLKAARAALANDILTLLEVAAEFDGRIKDKVRDRNSPFDLAYFNTSFAEMFLSLGRRAEAAAELNHALAYNNRYARAHLLFWKLRLQEGKPSEAEQHLRLAKEVWKDADPGFLEKQLHP